MKLLTVNKLKILAAVAMLSDHIGAYLLPQVTILRIIGRISFPIFAFCVAEGCRYTKNRLRYWATILATGIVSEAFTLLLNGKFKINIMGTLAVAVIAIYAFDAMRRAKNEKLKMINTVFFGAVLLGIYALTHYLPFEYGFFGALLPLSAFLYEDSKKRILAFSMMLLFLSASASSLQIFCLLAVPFLAMYNGQYGDRRLKYWFYGFYPAHLLCIYLIRLIIK